MTVRVISFFPRSFTLSPDSSRTKAFPIEESSLDSFVNPPVGVVAPKVLVMLQVTAMDQERESGEVFFGFFVGRETSCPDWSRRARTGRTDWRS